MRGLLLLAALIAAPAAADPLQDQLAQRMRATNTANVGFVSTTRIERTGSPAREIVTRYDPAAPAGRRWTVLRYDGRAPTAKESKDVLKAANRSEPPSYARLARWFAAPATRVAQAAGSVTYRFSRLPAGALKIGSHDASPHTSTERGAVVDTSGPTPFVSRVRYTSTKGFRMMLVAKVERYVFTATYAPLGDGRVFPAGQDADIAGAMMGKAGNIVTRTRYAAR